MAQSMPSCGPSSPRVSAFGTIHPKRFDLEAPLGSQISDGSQVRVAGLGTDVAFASAVEKTDRRGDPPCPCGNACPSTSVFPSTGVFFRPPFGFLRPALSGRGGLARRCSRHGRGDGGGHGQRPADRKFAIAGSGAACHGTSRSRPVRDEAASLASPSPASSAKKIGLPPWKRRRDRGPRSPQPHRDL